MKTHFNDFDAMLLVYIKCKEMDNKKNGNNVRYLLFLCGLVVFSTGTVPVHGLGPRFI